MSDRRKRRSRMGTASTSTPKGDERENLLLVTKRLILQRMRKGEKPPQHKHTVNKTIGNVSLGITVKIPQTKPA